MKNILSQSRISICFLCIINIILVSSCAHVKSHPVAGNYLYIEPEIKNVVLTLNSNYEALIIGTKTELSKNGNFIDVIEERKGNYSVNGDEIIIKAEGHELIGKYDRNGTIKISYDGNTALLRKMFPFKRHVLTIENRTEDFALVRIKSYLGVLQAELAINPGANNTTKLSDGNYFEVVRFGKNPANFRYFKGEGFLLSAPLGMYMNTTLTLHTTPTGKYSRFIATENDF